MQYSLMTKLELPIAALVHSGNKSIHAIVRIEASNEKEYSRNYFLWFAILLLIDNIFIEMYKLYQDRFNKQVF